MWNIRRHDRLLHLLSDGKQHCERRYDALIFCADATDRVVPMPGWTLPGWTLPGVTTPGTAQVALKS